MQREQAENPCGINLTELHLELPLHTSGDGELTIPADTPLLVLMPRVTVLFYPIETRSIILPISRTTSWSTFVKSRRHVCLLPFDN